MAKLYKVGGCVRDAILGVKTKDIDFTFVLEDTKVSVEDGWKIMLDYLKSNGFEVFLETPANFTVRAKFPSNHKFAGLTADFVMARKEVGYYEGTRQPILEVGSLVDDLKRRDFTVNALAEDENGNIIDLFGGREHLEMKLLVTPLDPAITFMDDPLRVLRGLRFSITKDLQISPMIISMMFHHDVMKKLTKVVSQERISDEVMKMMKHDTVKTLRLFQKIEKFYEPSFMEIIFKNGMWLMPTTKQ